MSDWTHCTKDDAAKMKAELDTLADEQQDQLDDMLCNSGTAYPLWCSRHITFWLHGEAVRHGFLKGWY